MKTCEPISEKLVSGAALTAEEEGHIAACPDCGSFSATVQDVARSARTVRSLQSVPAEETRAVTDHLAGRIRPARAFLRLAWASAALLLGVLGTVAVLSGVFGTDQKPQSEDRLLALLDEVSDITQFSEEDSVFDESDTTLFSAGLLFEEDISQEQKQIDLPDAYEALEQGLQKG